jgi:hypothetical protein
MSPTLPMSGVVMAAASSQAVSTQVTVLWLVFRSRWMVGRTGVIRDWSRENEAAATARTRKVRPGAVRSDEDMVSLCETR